MTFVYCAPLATLGKVIKRESEIIPVALAEPKSKLEAVAKPPKPRLPRAVATLDRSDKLLVLTKALLAVADTAAKSLCKAVIVPLAPASKAQEKPVPLNVK